MDKLDKIYEICNLLNQRFGDSSPFMIMTRLAEEVGEVAEQVNHIESIGVKSQKLGDPDKMQLAKEAQDVIRCVIHLVQKYELTEEFEQGIDDSLAKLQEKFKDLSS